MQFWVVMLALSVAVVEPVDAAGDTRQLQESMGCAADLNADGIVSTDDLLALLASFGRTPTGCSDEACQDELLTCNTDMAQMASDHEDTLAAQALLLSTCTEDLASATAALGDAEASFAAASTECVESTAALQAALEAEHVVAVAALQGSCNATLANSLASAQDECVAATSALQDALETEHDATLSVMQANCAEELENRTTTHGEVVADLTAQLEVLAANLASSTAALGDAEASFAAASTECVESTAALQAALEAEHVVAVAALQGSCNATLANSLASAQDECVAATSALQDALETEHDATLSVMQANCAEELENRTTTHGEVVADLTAQLEAFGLQREQELAALRNEYEARLAVLDACTDGDLLMSDLTVEDTHEGGGCGPVVVESADTSTATNCDRDYELGEGFASFFETYGDGMFLIQDAHDPNDHAWNSADFARITAPAGYVATLFLFVPGGENAGHSATAEEMPNVIDPRGGWRDTGETYQEANGITRHLWTKTVDGSYALHHAVAQGWGYLYMVQVRCFSAAVPIDCTMVTQPNVSPTQCYDDIQADTHIWQDRSYAWTNGPSDIIGGGWSYFSVSLETGNGAPCPHEGGFNGNIAAAATIAICCANHCNNVNTPVDQDASGPNPQHTLTWTVHPGTFAISNHGGEPCTFYEAQVPAGDYNICCSSCWASGLFLTDAIVEHVVAVQNPVPIDCTMVTQPNVSPTQCYDDIQADTHIWQDRSYAWTNGPSDIIGGGWSYFSVSLETGNGAPCPHEGGFNGNIAAAATIAICCANHCNNVNTPVDPTNTLTWTVHPGTFAISNHGGEPCTFYEAQVPAGDYNICCSSCWASGLFLTDAIAEQTTTEQAAVPIDCTMVTQPNVSPTQCYDDIQADTHIWQDRSYAWTNGPSDIIGGGWSYFSVSLETGNGAPCPHEGGFNGNIAAAATIAICCANHCNSVNTPVDPTNTLTWTVHPGTFAISNHGGEPCTFYEAQVPAGDYNICCSSCWASGLFLTDAFTPVAGVLPNMEAYYSFDDDNAFDSSGNARDGVWEGTETYVDGFVGRAASFDGLSAIYVSGFENFAWGQAFTISLWFWRGPGCDNNYVGIINGGGYHDTGSWEVRMGRENSCTGLGGGVSTSASLATWDHIWTGADGGVPPAPTDTWNHVVMSYDGVNAAFWLNSGDTGVSTRDNGDIVVDPDGLNIGKAGRPGYSAGQGGSEYFRGYVDEVQIFSAAADQQAVDRMFTGESGGRR